MRPDSSVARAPHKRVKIQVWWLVHHIFSIPYKSNKGSNAFIKAVLIRDSEYWLGNKLLYALCWCMFNYQYSNKLRLLLIAHYIRVTYKSIYWLWSQLGLNSQPVHRYIYILCKYKKISSSRFFLEELSLTPPPTPCDKEFF